MTESGPPAGGIGRSRSFVVSALIASATAFFATGVALLLMGDYELIGGVLLAVAVGDALCAFAVSRRAS